MNKHEREMHDKLVIHNRWLEGEVEKLNARYETGVRQISREQGKSEALGDVIKALINSYPKGEY